MSTINSGTRPETYLPPVSPLLPLLTGTVNWCPIGDSTTCGRVQENHKTYCTYISQQIAGGAFPSTTIVRVGTQNSGDTFDGPNEGYSGTGMAATLSRVSQFTSLAIDIATLLIMMNDANLGVDPDCNILLQWLLSAHSLRPSCRFLVLGTTTSTDAPREAALQRYRDRGPRVINRARAYGVPVLWHDLGPVLPKDGSMNADSLHPSSAGQDACGVSAFTPFQRLIGQ